MLAWVLGFLWFALLLPQPADDRTTDGIVVVTGGGGRIPRALTELRAGPRTADRGVDREVKPGEFAAEYGGSAPAAMLHHAGLRSGRHPLQRAGSARWIAAQRLHSIRLVTTDWHMRRAAFDLAAALPDDIVIVRDAVPSRPAAHPVPGIQQAAGPHRRLAAGW
jgi:uncharacterized SAM-binding protein YcdF (DUF218 family)